MSNSQEKLGWHSLGTSFDCPCGIRHALPIEACVVGDDAARSLADFAHSRCGTSCLVISDENTRQVCGEQLLSKMGKYPIKVSEHMFPAEAFEATLEKGDEVAALGNDVDFYVAIGAGTLSDLAKYAGNVQDKPVLLFPTAASMNGYSSAIVALKIRGLKRTMPCKPATGIFAEPAVVATAPQRMLAAGVADFLSKCSSSADWQAAHILRGDYYCPRPREFNEGVQEKLLVNASAIGRAEPDAVRLVLDALLLSGFGMVIAGSSAPASGGEHLLSHFIDMKHALYGTANDLHGTQVGVATVYTLGLWEKILDLEVADLDIEAILSHQPDNSLIKDRIFEDWGDAVGQEVWEQWTEKAPGTEELRHRIMTFCEHLPELRTSLSKDLLPANQVAHCIEACGGPTTAEAMLASTEMFQLATSRARYLRNRYTVLDLAVELGITPC